MMGFIYEPLEQLKEQSLPLIVLPIVYRYRYTMIITIKGRLFP